MSDIPKQMIAALPHGAQIVQHKFGDTWNDGGRWHYVVARHRDGSYLSVKMESDYCPDLLICAPLKQWPHPDDWRSRAELAEAEVAALRAEVARLREALRLIAEAEGTWQANEARAALEAKP